MSLQTNTVESYPSTKEVMEQTLFGVGRNLRPLLLYHLFFVLLAFVFLLPTGTWLSTLLLSRSGLPMVSPEEMLNFLASPAGVGWVFSAGILYLLFLFIHHSGMILIAFHEDREVYGLATNALWRVGRKTPGLLLLASLQVGTHLLISLPFLLVMVALWLFLLAQYDLYYLLSRYPPDFLLFLGICSVIGAAMLFCNGYLYLRWVLALPVLLLEKFTPLEALRKSSRITEGYRARIAVLVLSTALAVILVPGLLLAAFETLGGLALGWLPENFSILIPAVLFFLSIYIALIVLGGFFSVAVNSLLIERLYRNTLAAHPVQETIPPPKRTGILAWGTEILLLLIALLQAGIVLPSFFDFQDEVYITAHRGSSMKAPENTIPAIEQAILDGADYVEIDVRQTKDGVPVLLHDRDLRRIAGIPQPIWEMTLEEVRQIDAGGWFDPEYSEVGIPTLQEAIDTLRGRAKLYLEIKSHPRTPNLTASVVEMIRRKEMVEDTILAALEQEVLAEAKRLEPDLRTSLIIHTPLGTPDFRLLDALALRAAITDEASVRQARRDEYELHVWTVNDRREMSRFIDMGVDNIITDRPDVLADLLEERAELSDAELFLVKVRNWLRGGAAAF